MNGDNHIRFASQNVGLDPINQDRYRRPTVLRLVEPRCEILASLAPENSRLNALSFAGEI